MPSPTRSRSGWRSRRTTCWPRRSAARAQLAGRYGHVAHDVLAPPASCRADRRGPPRPAGRGRLRRPARAGAHRRRRAAAPHPARADRGARRCSTDAARSPAWRRRWARSWAGTPRAARARSAPSGPRRRRGRHPARAVTFARLAGWTGGAPRPGAVLPRRLIVLLILLLAFPAAARADWFPPPPIDGPNADVVVGRQRRRRPRRHRRDRLPARATAASRTRSSRACPAAAGGRPSAWTPTPGEATEVKVAVGDGNRLAVAWIADGNVYATVAPGGGRARRRSPARCRSAGRTRTSLDIDLGVNGAAYAVWEQSGDVRAARLQDTTWTARRAAAGRRSDARGRHRRAAAAGRGLGRGLRASSTWGDRTPHGRHARLGAPDHRPEPVRRPAGADDRRRRQRRLARHRHRGRRLVRVGRLPAGPRRRLAHGRAAADRLAVRGARADRRGRRVRRAADRHERRRARATRVAQGARRGARHRPWLDHDHFQPGGRLDSRRQRRRRPSRRSRPPTAATSRSPGATGTPGGCRARARFKDRQLADRAGVHGLATRSSGRSPTPACSSAATASGDFAVAMVQGTPGALALTAAIYDRPPGAPFIESSQAYKRKTRPELRWRPGLDLWGAQTLPRLHGRRADRRRRPPTRSCRATPLTRGQAHVAGRGRRPRRADHPQPRADAEDRLDRADAEGQRISGKRAAGQSAEDHRHGDGHAAAPGSITSPSTTATTRRRRSAATTPPPLQAREVHAEGRRGRQGGQRHRTRSSCGSRSRDPARRLAAAELGARPLLMGILNATPGLVLGRARRGAASAVRLERGRALVAAGADIVDIGGESARGDRPGGLGRRRRSRG